MFAVLTLKVTKLINQNRQLQLQLPSTIQSGHTSPHISTIIQPFPIWFTHNNQPQPTPATHHKLFCWSLWTQGGGNGAHLCVWTASMQWTIVTESLLLLTSPVT
jgi:hypothetical protein